MSELFYILIWGEVMYCFALSTRLPLVLELVTRQGQVLRLPSQKLSWNSGWQTFKILVYENPFWGSIFAFGEGSIRTSEDVS